MGCALLAWMKRAREEQADTTQESERDKKAKKVTAPTQKKEEEEEEEKGEGGEEKDQHTEETGEAEEEPASSWSKHHDRSIYKNSPPVRTLYCSAHLVDMISPSSPCCCSLLPLPSLVAAHACAPSTELCRAC